MKKLISLITLVLVLVGAWLVFVGHHRMVSGSRLPASTKVSPVAPPGNSVAAPAVTPAPKAAAGAALDEKQKALAQIAATNACYASEACAFPQTDPRSYDYAVGQSLARQLREFAKRFRGVVGSEADLDLLARTYIVSPDPYVQSVALDLMSERPISDENLKALREGVESSSDPLLVTQALAEFKRYLGTPAEPQVHEALATIINSGAHFSSQAVAEAILPFLNPSSVDRYRQTAATMPTYTTAAARLRSALTEFDRQRAGG